MKPRTDAARAAWVTFAATLPLYLVTMNPTIGFIDRGELAAVAWTFGIAHAPGYPTLMLVAGLLAHAVPLRPVLVLNVFAALLVAAGAAVLVLLLDHVLRSVAGSMKPRTRAVCAAIGALFTATTMTWWQQANGFEVYALHALLMPLVVLLGLRWIDASATDERAARRAGIAFALVTGLSFTNHLTTALLAPGLLAVAIARFGLRAPFWRRIAGLAPWFVLGLLPYVWLPIRSAMQPRFDWGNPETLRAFIHHVTAADYHNRVFSDAYSVVTQVRYMLWHLPWDQAWIGLPIAGLGALLLVRRARPLAALAALTIVTGFTFAAGYRIPDIDAYLLTVTLGIAICFTAGIASLWESAGTRRVLVAGLALVLVNGAIHWNECDERHNRMAEAFVHDMLGPLPQNALLISTAWDVGLSASCYFQEVEGFRRDVVVVVPDLVRVSWYLDELERRAPELIARCRGPFDQYRETLRAIERGGGYRSTEVEHERQVFLAALAAGAMRDRGAFTTDALPAAPASWRMVPYHLAMWLRTDSDYVPEPRLRYAFRPWEKRPDCFTARVCWGYGAARLARAQYEAAYGLWPTSRVIAASIRNFDPHIRAEQIGPQPIGTDEIVLAAARFFETYDGAEQIAVAGASRR